MGQVMINRIAIIPVIKQPDSMSAVTVFNRAHPPVLQVIRVGLIGFTFEFPLVQPTIQVRSYAGTDHDHINAGRIPAVSLQDRLHFHESLVVFYSGQSFFF